MIPPDGSQTRARRFPSRLTQLDFHPCRLRAGLDRLAFEVQPHLLLLLSLARRRIGIGLVGNGPVVKLLLAVGRLGVELAELLLPHVVGHVQEGDPRVGVAERVAKVGELLARPELSGSG
jgi:hypothetical protein